MTLHPIKTRKKLPTPERMLPMLEAIVQTGKPLVIVAETAEGEALANPSSSKRQRGVSERSAGGPRLGFGDRRKRCCRTSQF